ncbi:hypothetical protein A6770_16505 [Nostoc minutum NIES-26]|uniref:Uncharacterized protein n=1 Tax=Nostoc minutum NIES-26 TaxID=1844469 RepID=A0A367RFS3_9NOSO|nr:hypothetical protein A6770_16505 [Nostoc minutum NIES-26]
MSILRTGAFQQPVETYSLWYMSFSANTKNYRFQSVFRININPLAFSSTADLPYFYSSQYLRWNIFFYSESL